MYKVIEGLFYENSDEWLKVDEEIGTVGITDYAQDKLGDIVYLEEAKIGKVVNKGDVVISIESVKAAADIHSPVSGEIVEVNLDAVKNTVIINEDPYGKGWLFKIKIKDKNELKDLMDAKAYSEYRQ